MFSWYHDAEYFIRNIFLFIPPVQLKVTKHLFLFNIIPESNSRLSLIKSLWSQRSRTLSARPLPQVRQAIYFVKYFFYMVYFPYIPQL